MSGSQAKPNGDSIEAKIGDAGAAASEQIAELRKKVEELVAERSKYVGAALDTAQDYAGRAADAAQVGYGEAQDFVRERPAQSLLIAAAVGFVLARILGR